MGDLQANTAKPKGRESQIHFTVWGLRITVRETTGELYGGQENGEDAIEAKHWERAGNDEENATRSDRNTVSENKPDAARSLRLLRNGG